MDDRVHKVFEHIRKKHLEYLDSKRQELNDFYRDFDEMRVNKKGFRKLINHISEHVDFTDKWIIDFGCGISRADLIIKGYERYAGVDISDFIIDQLNHLNCDRKVFVRESMTSIKPPGKFHIGLCLNSLHHTGEFKSNALNNISMCCNQVVFYMHKPTIDTLGMVADYFEIEHSEQVVDDYLIIGKSKHF